MKLCSLSECRNTKAMMNNENENRGFEMEIELYNALLMVHRMSLWIKTVSLIFHIRIN